VVVVAVEEEVWWQGSSLKVVVVVAVEEEVWWRWLRRLLYLMRSVGI
jgi:hypothetical protein